MSKKDLDSFMKYFRHAKAEKKSIHHFYLRLNYLLLPFERVVVMGSAAFLILLTLYVYRLVCLSLLYQRCTNTKKFYKWLGFIFWYIKGSDTIAIWYLYSNQMDKFIWTFLLLQCIFTTTVLYTDPNGIGRESMFTFKI